MEIEKPTTDKSKLILVVSVIILVGALFGAMGYLLGSKNNDGVIKSEDQMAKDQDIDRNIETEKEKNNNEKKEEIENIEDDWQRYADENNNFEFILPKELVFSGIIQKGDKGGSGNLPSSNEEIIFEPVGSLIEYIEDNNSIIKWNIKDKSNEVVFSIFKESKIKSGNASNEEFAKNYPTPKDKITNMTLVSLNYDNGIIKQEFDISDPLLKSGPWYYTSNKEYFYIFIVNKDDNKELVEKILSSFKFTDFQDETADWNVYKNEEIGVQFKYPQEAEIVLEKENEIRINLPIISEQYASEKYLLVNKKYTDGECSNPLFTRIGETEAVAINGVDFVKEIGGGAAAGSTYYSVSYSTLKNNWCTSLSFVVRSHNYKLDKNKEYAIFDQIISTFKLIKSLNETANLKVYNGNMINKNGKSFSFNYSSELWILNDNGHFSNKKLGSCEFSPGGLFRQSMSNVVETKKMYFGNYEARKTRLGNDSDGVLRINVYFDIDLSSEFSLLLPENKNEKQTCENDFDTILSTISFL